MPSIVFDIESDGLLDTVTEIHCISLQCLGGKESLIESYTSRPMTGSTGSIQDALEVLSGGSVLIGHNIIGYDLPLLKALYNWEPSTTTEIKDTYVVSRLQNPDRVRPPGMTGKGGPHSLEAWGYRLGRNKPDHKDWSVLTPEMLHRNKEDVGINTLVYEFLKKEAEGHNWKKSTEIESQVFKIINQQEKDGVCFDVDSASTLIRQLTDSINDIDNLLLPNLPKRVEQKGVTINEPFKINGEHKQIVYKWMGELTKYVSGPFTRVDTIGMNLGSMPQVKNFLLDNGWKPTEWNIKNGERTSPKLTEDSFGTIDGEVGTLIKRRFLNKHRQSQIQGWLSRVRDDGRLSAGADTCGTNTGRFRHYNVVNVPKASPDVFLGYEMRSLFTASPGRVMVGHDASGLELRMLAHYMGDEGYVNAILHGDIHSLNQVSAKLDTRDQAKTFIYAFLYGAGNEKIGFIVGGTAEDGARLKRDFLKATPSLGRLIKNVKRASRKGWLRGLDGRKIMMRRKDGRVMEHKALNTLLQCGGAVLMKKSMILLDSWVKEEGLDVIKVLDMHDEAQADVAVKDVERYGELARLSIVKAGEYFKLDIPMDADVKVGKNWAETH